MRKSRVRQKVATPYTKRKTASTESAEKRPRGRPRIEKEPKEVRPRGRPRTRPIIENAEKRPRGRPRKDGTPINSERPEPTVVRPRGRPRKDGTPINSARAVEVKEPKKRGRPAKQKTENEFAEIPALPSENQITSTVSSEIVENVVPVAENSAIQNENIEPINEISQAENIEQENYDFADTQADIENSDEYSQNTSEQVISDAESEDDELQKGESYKKLQLATKGIISAKINKTERVQPAKHSSVDILERKKEIAPIVSNAPLMKMNISRPRTPMKEQVTRAPRSTKKASPMPNKVVVVTGATSGMGLATAKSLAGLGHIVIGIGRKPSLCRDAIREILDEYPDANIHYLVADLSLMSQVKVLADEIKEKIESLNRECIDVLIHNAGANLESYQLTYENREYMWATNYLSAVLLTRELQPLLDRSLDARVITFTTTYASHHEKINWKQLRDRSGKFVSKIYEQTKLADLMFALEYDHENANQEGLHAYCVDPGTVNTGLNTKNASGIKRAYNAMKSRKGKSIEQGIETVVYLATAENLPANVVFYADKKPQEPSKFALDAENRVALKRITQADLRDVE